MTEILLPIEKFRVITLQEHFTNGLYKEHLDACFYIEKYYFEMSDGNYQFYNVSLGKFELVSRETFRITILLKIDESEDVVRYFNRNNKIYEFISKPDNPRIFKDGLDYYINTYEKPNIELVIEEKLMEEKSMQKSKKVIKKHKIPYLNDPEEREDLENVFKQFI